MHDHSDLDKGTSEVPGINTRTGLKISSERIRAELEKQDGNLSRAAAILGCSRETLRGWVQRASRADQSARYATFDSVLPEHPKRDTIRTVEDIHRDHGVSIDDFTLTNLTDNYWRGNDGEGPAVLTQSKATFKPKLPDNIVLPYRPHGKRYRRSGRKSNRPYLLEALPSDQHCPHEDKVLDSLWLRWLEYNQPDGVTGVGDLMNLSKPSRHRQNLGAKYNDDPQKCVDSGGAWWERTAQAAPNARRRMIPGNHDLRVDIAVLEKTPELYGLRRRGEEHPFHDLEYMLALDDLGVEYIRPTGEYHSSSIEIVPGVMVAHGVKSGPFGGAPREADKHENHRAIGHGHKASITLKVRYRNGEPWQHIHVSIPAMCSRDMGYQDDPDVQQGFATLVAHENGSINFELAIFDERTGTLTWRDQLYEA